MNANQFLEHYHLSDNPFRGEEARHDGVLQRLTSNTEGAPSGFVHSAFDKVLGSIDTPSTAIVFGEKGSGKTAIRLQIEQHVAHFNQTHDNSNSLLVTYDDLNTVLDRLHERIGGKDPLESFKKITLADHMDALLGVIVPGAVDSFLGNVSMGSAGTLAIEPMSRHKIKQMDASSREDMLVLQSVYDHPTRADLRTKPLRKLLKLRRPIADRVWELLALVAWLPGVVALAWLEFLASNVFDAGWQRIAVQIFGVCFLVLWLVAMLRVHVVDRLRRLRIGKRLRKHNRTTTRTESSFASSMSQLSRTARELGSLPTTSSEEPRYAMLDRVQRVLRSMGYTGLMVVIDRVDEPSLVSGHAERMRAIVWPMLNNKFLQQQGIGFKLLLPIELRHALMKESSAFFQEARLDKQGLVDRLSWTGSMLFDLCEARLRACTADGNDPIALLDLFAEDVTSRDLVEALDQMHQPRDAFKFLYACITEFCSSVTHTEDNWRIPRLLLESVRRVQSERVQALYRGITPA